MSLLELNAAFAGASGTAWTGEPITKSDLEALMDRFPDHKSEGFD